MTIESSPPASTWNLWGIACRPTLLFITAYALSMTPHEAVHATVAYLLGFSSTLFQLWVNPDAAQASPEQRALIAASGPIFSVSVGLVCLLVYRKLKNKPSGLIFLMLATFGIYTFLGNLFATAMGGDFNIAFTALEAPKFLLYVASVVALVLLSFFMFFVGRELLRWAPPNFDRVKAVAITAVAPWLIGTVLALILYLPLPPFLIVPNLIGSIFWLFAVLGATFGRELPRSVGLSSITRWDFILTLAAILTVRLLVYGVRFSP